MRGFVILTTRKRVVVALVHTVVFLLVALLLARISVRPLTMASPPGSWALAGVYTVVTGVLAILVAYAGRAEKLYFALCAASAALGLARQILGDPRLHAAVYVRVAQLAGAVFLGFLLLGRHRAAPAEAPMPPATGQPSLR
jgi:hypothetical protein